MLRPITLLVSVLLTALSFSQSVSERAAVRLTATVQAASITLNWVSIPSTTSLTIYRKAKAATSWGTAVATPASSALQWTDNSVSVGTNYEYRVVRVSAGVTGSGYISTGIQVQSPDYRGKMVLLVDNTLAPQLVSELNQLTYDLRADGWTVLRNDVSRTATVTSVRSLVQGHYNSDPTNVKAVYIVGHVPVPYSGNVTPDGHPDGQGARPTDGYYGEMNGTWTDNSVNTTISTHTQAWNTPGDGKFDQSDFPSALELQVGRVDLYDMPAFGSTEVQLMRNYLNKAHSYKIKGWSPTVRGLVIDFLQWVGNPIAASGFRTAPLTGNADLTPAAPVLAYSNYINNQSYLWTYHCGGGLQAVDGGVVTYNGTDGGATTQQLASSVTMGGVFNMSMGSFYYDFDNRNNYLRAMIARGDGLTSCWAGIPSWYFHHMGMGDNIGYSTLQTMNNTGLYTPLTEGWQSTIGRTHMNLMGDPSLRMKMVAPPTNLAITNSGGQPAFTWTASTESVSGYHIYQIEPTTGMVTRLTTNPVTGTSYTAAAVPFVAGREYLVRAVKLESNFSGSYHNLSLGALGTAAGTAAADCLGVVGGTATVGSACNDNNPCTTGDVYNTSCQCVGTSITPVATITAGGTTSFCTGGSVVLNANTGTGYSYVWKRNSTTISGATSSSYTATLAGSYIVTVTNAGCSVTSAVTTVTVNAAPTATITAGGATTFCNGGSVNLAGNTGTGYTYVWKRGGTTISGATSSSYSATVAGSYTVVISNGGCSTTSSATTVTVTGVPTAAITASGSTSFCTGGSVVLNGTTGTGYTYVWKRGGTAISGATASSYTASIAGSYTVTITSGGCATTSAATAVTVNTAPTATITAGSTTTFCADGNVTLTSSTGTGYTYVWQRNGTAISGATNSSYSATLAGTYTVLVSVGGCSKTSGAIAVTVNAGPTVTCSSNGTAATVSVVASGGLAPYTYSWNTSPIRTTATAPVTASGSYTATVTDARGCTSSCTSTITLTSANQCAGIRTESQNTWGATASGANAAAYMTSNFATAFPSPNYLTIGCGTRTLRLTSASAVTAFLPSTGTTARLPYGVTQNPGSAYGNTLAGQLVALKLSVRFDELSTSFSPATVQLKNMIIASGTFAGWTVQQLITAADSKIGGCGGTYTRTSLNTAITAVNDGYLAGTMNSGYLSCPSIAAMQVPTGNDDLNNDEDQALEEDGLDIIVFPNPVRGTATILITGASDQQPTMVEIRSLSGGLVEQLFYGTLATGMQHRIEWNAEGRSTGLYFYRVVSGDKTSSGKIVVE